MNTPYNVSEFIIERESYSDDIVLIIGQNSYLYDSYSIKEWFYSVGVSAVMINHILDSVWNFRRVKYIIPQQRLLTNV